MDDVASIDRAIAYIRNHSGRREPIFKILPPAQYAAYIARLGSDEALRNEVRREGYDDFHVYKPPAG